MPSVAKNLSVSTVIEKNKIASDSAFLVLVEIDVKNPTTGAFVETLRFANNTADVNFLGQTYTKYPFSMDVKEEEGSLSEISLTIEDIQRTIQGRMQEYGGGIGFDTRLKIVSSDSLNQEADLEQEFEIVAASANDYSVSFTLGIVSPLSSSFPRRKYFREQGFPSINTSSIRY